MFAIHSPHIICNTHYTIYKLLIILTLFTGGARNTLVVAVVVVIQRIVTVMVAVTVKKRVDKSLVAVIVDPAVHQTTAAVVTAIAVVAAILVQKFPPTQVDLDQQKTTRIHNHTSTTHASYTL